MSNDAPITLAQRDDVWILSLTCPPVNAIDLALVEALRREAARAADAPACRALVITGAGGSFCAGINTKVVPGYDRQTRHTMIRAINQAIFLLYGLSKPTVAAVNGHALGGGLVLALACDARVAAEGRYRLGLTEVSAGIPFPACPMIVVRAELDPRAARDLVLTGRTIEPGDPAAAAFLDATVPAERLLETAVARAREVSGHAAYGTVKRQLKAEALGQMATIVGTDGDPLLEGWF